MQTLLTNERALPLWQRLYIYQRERFPLMQHGLAILSFSTSAVLLSAAWRGTLPSMFTLAAAFLSSLGFFFQLRVIDEFKDNRQDSQYRPYRAVPRGLVSLPELTAVALALACLQVALAATLGWPMLVALAAVWAFLFLLSQDFFLGKGLAARPILYMLTHMAVMPVIDFYTCACDWLPLGREPGAALVWFLLVSYVNGMVIEIGRKIRCQKDEEEGVITYSRLWGSLEAVHNWQALVLATTALALTTAVSASMFAVVALVLAPAAWYVLRKSAAFARACASGQAVAASPMEKLSAIWTLAVYGSLALASYLHASPTSLHPLAWHLPISLLARW